MNVVENVAKILNQLEQISAANERSEPPTLLAVSKLKDSSEILKAYNAGLRLFGENYVQELVIKAEELPKDIDWILIGRLQRNKCKMLLQLARKLECVCVELSRSIEVLIQVKGTDEDSKTGIDSEQVVPLVRHILLECPHLIFCGLMTIGHGSEHSETLKAFSMVRKLTDQLWETFEGWQTADSNMRKTIHFPQVKKNLILSMGMSGDLKDAIKAGSTEVRVGTLIFGTREKLVESSSS